LLSKRCASCATPDWETSARGCASRAARAPARTVATTASLSADRVARAVKYFEMTITIPALDAPAPSALERKRLGREIAKLVAQPAPQRRSRSPLPLLWLGASRVRYLRPRLRRQQRTECGDDVNGTRTHDAV